MKSKVKELVEKSNYRSLYVYDVELMLNECISNIDETLKLVDELEREWLFRTNIEYGLKVSEVIEILDKILSE